MSENEENKSGSLKLQLNRSFDANKLKQGFAGSKAKTVTVEVRKNRSIPKTDSASQNEQKVAAPDTLAKATSGLLSLSNVAQTANKPKPDSRLADSPTQDKSLTEEEKNNRLKVIRQAAIAEEKEKAEAERRRKELEERERIRKQQEEAERLAKEKKEREEEEAREEKLRQKEDKKKKRNKEAEIDLTDTFLASKTGNKGNQSYQFREEYLEELEELGDDVILNPLIVEAEPAPLEEKLRKNVILEDDEIEDYSEDIENDDDNQVIYSSTAIPIEKKLAIVRPVKGSERVIVAAPDPEKIKKNLRSEAAAPSVIKPKSRYEEPRKNSVRVVLSQFSEQNEEQRSRSVASAKRHRDKLRKHSNANKDIEKVYREVIIPESITVQELASRMTEKVGDVIKSLMKMGMMVTANQTVDSDTAELVVAEFGHTPKRVLESDIENTLIDETPDDEASLEARPPVVTVMGHVDHGKTTLLDALRSTDVAAGEAGGITQHIGAYQVKLANGAKITFLDTPGHSAFTAMRARGAKVTDIVVLVIAADDGIKEQTVEAINHAKAAGVPIIVAVNKIDKPDANPQRAKEELLSHDLVPEDLGGDIMTVEISAKQRMNLDKLEEAILLQAEILELRANPNKRASGVVIEAKVDKGRGVIASVLVQAGTLKVGDLVLAGTAYGRVKTLVNDKGQNLESALPSAAVEILGLDNAPMAGDMFNVVESERVARSVAEYRQQKIREKQLSVSSRALIDQFMESSASTAKVKELPVIVKGDVQGSVEAIIGSLGKITHEEARIKVLHSGVGAITESDIVLANASGAIVLGFNVRANTQAKDLASRDGIEIKYYSIIYDLVDDMKDTLSGIIAPKKREKFIGYAEIRKVYDISKTGKIGGCMVTQGVIKRGSKVRMLRDDVVIHEGWLKTLKRFKDEVKEVKEGFECGMAFENYDDIREGDVIEASEIEEFTVKIE